MRILVSGEGVSDMGCCSQGGACDHPEFEPGPMALLADQIVEEEIDYPCLPHWMRLVPEATLAARSKMLKPPKLAGRKSPKETAFFYRNARALAQLTTELGEHPSASLLVSLVQQGRVDAHSIDMPSFNQFKRCLVNRLRPQTGTTCEQDP